MAGLAISPVTATALMRPSIFIFILPRMRLLVVVVQRRRLVGSLFGGTLRQSLVLAAEIAEGRLHPTAAVWNAGQLEPHLHAGEGAHEHAIVEVAEVADAQALVGDLGKAAAERHVEVLERDLAEMVDRKSTRLNSSH